MVCEAPSARTVLLLAIAACVVLLPGLSRTDLFNPDEPREAEMSREMDAGAGWLVPHLNGLPFLEKPPLFYWLVVSAYRIAGGPGELAARAVPAISGILFVLLTYGFGCRMVGERSAALGATVLLTTGQLYWLARHCMIDMSLALAVLVTLGAIFRGMTTRSSSRFAWFALGYASMAAAMMLKGVVGAGLPAIVILAYLAAHRDWRGLWRCGLVPGGVIASLPLLGWVLALQHFHGAEATRDFVFRNNFQRFTGGAKAGHEQPFHYYAGEILVDFLPWSPLLVAALIWAFMRSRGQAQSCDEQLSESHREGIAFAFAWFVAPVLVLSLASTKRGIYLLPLFPAAALLIGSWLARLPASPPSRSRAGVRVPAAASLIVVTLLVVTVTTALALIGSRSPLAWIATAFALGLLAFTWQTYWKESTQRFAMAAATSTALTLAVVGGALMPEMVNRQVSHRGLAQVLRRLVDQGYRVILYDVGQGQQGGILFYSRMLIPNPRNPADLRSLLTPPAGRGIIALVRKETYSRTLPELHITARLRGTDPTPGPLLSKRQYVLVDLTQSAGP